MTDFDKLIKEKAEEASYSYKSSAWRKFQKQTGTFRPLRYWVSGMAVTVIAGVSVGLYVHHHSSVSTSNSTPEQIVVLQDSVENYPVLQSEPVTEAKGEPSTQKVVVNHSNTTQEMPEVAPPPSENIPSKDNQRTVVRKTQGRPLVIDVDTIKDNVPSDEELRKGNSRLF